MSLTKEEWWDITRELRPDWTEEEFEEAWVEFQDGLAEYLRRKALH